MNIWFKQKEVMYKKEVSFVLVLLMGWCSAHAQNVITGFEFGEIRNIAEAYRQVPDLSFDVVFKYADSASQNSILEQMNGSYKIKSGKYRVMIDSTEIVQGSSYKVTISYYNKVIAVLPRQQYANVMQLPFLDSLFRTQNVDSMRVTISNDSTRKLQMFFNPGSQYSGFSISYNLHSYLLHSITYFVKMPAIEGETGSGVSMIKVIFSNYSRQVIDENYFREGQFIYKQGDQFLAQSPYEGFQLMVNIY